MKPKYIIYCPVQDEYYLSYMQGYTTNKKEAHRYTEEEIQDILREGYDWDWLLNTKLIQVYGEQ